ncbi:hypothetical protein I6G37_03150 [Serratia rubidaea]|nr:hypothetical protein I6G37_03150 [Serratia rubidaea]
MKNSLKITIAIVTIFAAVLVYFLPMIKMNFAGSAHYTEQDRREYDFYTPEILRDMPRISQRYDFNFANITGPAMHVNAVRFYGTRDTSKIDSYLISKEYKEQETCDLEAVCWKASDPQETIYVGTLTTEDTVQVQVAYDFYK